MDMQETGLRALAYSMQETGLRALAYSMGSHLLVLALGPNILSSSPGPHKMVFSAADSLQQLFCHLAEQNVGEAPKDCALLTSNTVEALQCSEFLRNIPGFIETGNLQDENCTGSGSPAGCSCRLLC